MRTERTTMSAAVKFAIVALLALNCAVLARDDKNQENKDFGFQNIEIGEHKFYEFTECQKLVLTVGYKPVKIVVNNATNINGLLFTNKEMLVNCSKSDFFKLCQNGPQECSYTANPKGPIEYRSTVCTDKIYLYAKVTINPHTEASINITSEIIDNTVQCKDLNPTGDVIVRESIKCSQIPISKCLKTCDADCGYYKCLDEFNTVVGEHCLSINIPESERSVICQAYDSKNVQVSNQCNIAEVTVQHHPFMTLMGISIILFFIICIFYNWRLKKTGVPPFGVPPCCPNFCFPRSYQAPEPPKRNSEPPEDLTKPTPRRQLKDDDEEIDEY